MHDPEMGYSLRKRTKIPAAIDPRKGTASIAAHIWMVAIVLISLAAFVSVMLEIDG
jgi:hypothetical protein